MHNNIQKRKLTGTRPKTTWMLTSALFIHTLPQDFRNCSFSWFYCWLQLFKNICLFSGPGFKAPLTITLGEEGIISHEFCPLYYNELNTVALMLSSDQPPEPLENQWIRRESNSQPCHSRAFALRFNSLEDRIK